jgi:non-specific serine/threonine protein kinase
LRVGGLGDAGAVLDAPAKTAYKRRLEELQDELAEAQRFHDPVRAAKAQSEIDFLAAELAAAVGVGGRDRRAAAIAERARLNVTKAIKAALSKISESHPPLGHHLATSIKTGTFCTYTPDPTQPISWTL